ncbi:MAG: sigma factor-like helix-turn-helix DNA-binding protein, partial [Pseudomonadota bacterium]
EGYAVPQEEQPDFETPLRSLEKKDSANIVYGVLETISPKKRMVFTLHEILGFDAKEIALMMDANVLTIRTRLHYARKEFYEKVMESSLWTSGEL